MGIGALAIVAVFMLVFLAFFGICIAIIATLVRNHVQASKYRELLELAQQQTPSKVPQWRVTYMEGKKQRTMMVPANDEADAVRLLLQKGINPRSVVSMEPSV